MGQKWWRENNLTSVFDKLDHLRAELDQALEAGDTKEAERLMRSIQELAKNIDEQLGNDV